MQETAHEDELGQSFIFPRQELLNRGERHDAVVQLKTRMSYQRRGSFRIAQRIGVDKEDSARSPTPPVITRRRKS
jgi:hypothetical protein